MRLVTGLVTAMFGLFTFGCCIPEEWIAGIKGSTATPDVLVETPPEPDDLSDRTAALFPAAKVCGETAVFPAWCAVSKVADAGWSAPAVDQRFVGLSIRIPTGDSLEAVLGREFQLAALAVGPNTAGFTLLSPNGPRVRGEHNQLRDDIAALLAGKGGPDLSLPASVESLLGGASAAAGALSDVPAGGGTFSSGGAWRIWRVTGQSYGEAIVVAGETSGGIELALFPLVALVPGDAAQAEEGAEGDGPMKKSARSKSSDGSGARSPKSGAKGPGKNGPGVKGKALNHGK